MFFVTFFSGEQPVFDDTPQDGDGCTSVAVRVDESAAKTLVALCALGSFDVARALAAVYTAGVNAGQRQTVT
jgi:hypothetical protein